MYVELPPFNMLPGVLVCYDNHQLADLSSHHPLVQLGHDLLDVGFDLVVGRYQHIEAIFLDAVVPLARSVVCVCARAQWIREDVR